MGEEKKLLFGQGRKQISTIILWKAGGFH